MNRLIHPYPFLAQTKSPDAHAHSKCGKLKKRGDDILLSFYIGWWCMGLCILWSLVVRVHFRSTYFVFAGWLSACTGSGMEVAYKET
jgi:hypothetical protein